MRASLTLPLPTRHQANVDVPVVDELEPVVESVRTIEQVNFSTLPLSSEVNLNSLIMLAQLNAEANMRMTMNHSGVLDETSPVHALGRHREKSISFGNESELEYVEDEMISSHPTSVRLSKNFDGNRSGRPSAKQ